MQEVSLGFGAYVAFAAGASACRKKPEAKPKPVAWEPVRPEFPKELHFFNPQRFLTLAAAAEALLPRDEDPGAIDLGVPGYVDRALAQDDLSPWRKPIVDGLDHLDRQCMQRFHHPFAEASGEEQATLLAEWQVGESGETRFFEVLQGLTFEGAFGDPSYGGNTGGRGFAMVGFMPGPPMPGMDLVKLAPAKEGK